MVGRGCSLAGTYQPRRVDPQRFSKSGSAGRSLSPPSRSGPTPPPKWPCDASLGTIASPRNHKESLRHLPLSSNYPRTADPDRRVGCPTSRCGKTHGLGCLKSLPKMHQLSSLWFIIVVRLQQTNPKKPYFYCSQAAQIYDADFY